MSSVVNKTTYGPAVLEFKSSSSSVPVLVLSSNDLEAISGQLQDKIASAPEFFRHLPVVFDLDALNRHGLPLNVANLVGLLRGFNLLPVGIRGGSALQVEAALGLHIPVYSTHNGLSASPVQHPSPKAAQPPANKLVSQPVRSGQRIYAAGDLIVTAQVSAGAEIMAEGNIHVYGSLRGRALAGVQGDENARIFCFDLQAELIAIAGNYKISEDISAAIRHQPVQVCLHEGSLIIKNMV